MQIQIPKYAEKIKIDDRGHEGVYVLWEGPYGPAYRTFATTAIAKRFARGDKLTLHAPKIARRIRTSLTASNPMPFEDWSERRTSIEILTAPLIGYHFGLPAKIKQLAEVETCFYAHWPKQKTYVYSGTLKVIVPVGKKVEWYDDEFRITLNNSLSLYMLKEGWLGVS